MEIKKTSLDSFIKEANTQFTNIQYTTADVYINHISKGIPVANSKKIALSGDGSEYTTDYPDVPGSDLIQIVLKKELNGITYTVLSKPASATCNKAHAI